MSTSPQNPAHEAIRTLRIQLGEDLHAFAAADTHAFAGYVIGWLRACLDLTDLEDLVDELDRIYRVEGQRILERPRKPQRDS